MQKELLVGAVLCVAAATPAWAGYTIDGNLSDWGVTPFSQWVPNPPASYTVMDNVGLPSTSYYEERYDYEAMYFADDVDNFYFGVVSSQPLGHATGGGDLGLDLNGDMTVSPQGVVTGLEYAVHVASGNLGQVVSNPNWQATYYGNGSPYVASGGTSVGYGAIAVGHYPTLEPGSDPDTYILEAAIPRNILPGYGGDVGAAVGIHMTSFCGNDSINLQGIIGVTPETPGSVPAPSAIVLGGLGVGLIRWLRGRRALG